MPNFKRRALIVAVQYTGENSAEIVELLAPTAEECAQSHNLTIQDTSIGQWNLAPTDWLVKENGVFTKMADQAFQESFEKI